MEDSGIEKVFFCEFAMRCPPRLCECDPASFFRGMRSSKLDYFVNIMYFFIVECHVRIYLSLNFMLTHIIYHFL
jgi:hypothetical protein